MAGQKRLGKNASVPSGYLFAKTPFRAQIALFPFPSRGLDAFCKPHTTALDYAFLFKCKKSTHLNRAAIEKFSNNQSQLNVSRRAQANMKVNVLTARR
jgi:hypothetical protein